jgi:tetratricopeptide (TPR) repeat protein
MELSNRKGMWEQLVNGFKSAVNPIVYATEIIARSLNHQTDLQLEAEAQREQKRVELQQLQLMMRGVHHRDRIEFESAQAELEHQFQTQLAQLYRATFSDRADRYLAQTAQLETAKLDLQKWAIEQQQSLQLELKGLELQLAREQQRTLHSPIWLTAGAVLSTHPDAQISPLKIFLSPPKLDCDSHDHTKIASNDFPLTEKYLGRDLRKFFDLYSSSGRPIEFLAGAWKSKIFHGESAAKSVFIELQTEAAMILEANVEGDLFDLNLAFRGVDLYDYRYRTAISLSWQELLYDCARARTISWSRKQQKAGRSRHELVQLYGRDVVDGYFNNLAIYRREGEWLKLGEDPTELERNYHLIPKDYDQLRRILGIYHCVFAGILADEYFLIQVPAGKRSKPLLPTLLVDLLVGIPRRVATEITQVAIDAYRTMYAKIAEPELAWFPELQLDLALILLPRSDRSTVREIVTASVMTWLNLQGIAAKPEDDWIGLIYKSINVSDTDYVNKLNSCLHQLQSDRQLSIADACYDRGIEYFQAGAYTRALREFTATIELNFYHADTYYDRGLTYLALHQYPEAIIDLERVISLNPDRAIAYSYLGNIYDKLANRERAIYYYDLAIEHGLTSAQIHRDSLLAAAEHPDLSHHQQS